MADENPTGRDAAVALKLPADHVCFLRSTFRSAKAGIRDELKEYPTNSRSRPACAARTPLTGASSRRWTSA